MSHLSERVSRANRSPVSGRRACGGAGNTPGPVGESLHPLIEAIEDWFRRRVPDAKANPERAVTNGALLTSRKRDVLTLIAQGAGNARIAAGLVLSERTVARHVANIYLKLGVHNRAQAVAAALNGHDPELTT